VGADGVQTTNSILLLPIIGGVFVVEVLTVILQTISKKVRKKKIWLSTPIHHHLEAIGWGESKVTMRFWVIGGVLAFVGIFVALGGGIIAQ
jgi:phospho-N-acetylmuramoyl-pentapeptide-transferase